MAAASYHQILPSFLDFLFSFGAQHHAEDFFFAGFRHDTRLSDLEKAATISALGRSGRVIQLCYSLRSVEAARGQESWPWSVRGAATHHTFDIENGRAGWAIVKGEGGASMKDRIITETSSQNGNMLNKFGNRSQVFTSTLLTHLLLCNWSTENWRWYINYMEKEVQAVTRKTLSMNIAKPQGDPKPILVFTRTATGVLVPPKKSPTSKSTTANRTGLPLAQLPPKSSNAGPPGLA